MSGEGDEKPTHPEEINGTGRRRKKSKVHKANKKDVMRRNKGMSEKKQKSGGEEIQADVKGMKMECEA